MPDQSNSPPDCPFDKIYPSQLEKDNLFYMKLAYNQAIEAWDRGEVPVGAIIVKDEEVIASAYNQTEANADPTAHAGTAGRGGVRGIHQSVGQQLAVQVV